MIRQPGEWYEISVDRYLDQRFRNWELAEEFGDVVFISERGVVLVHRVRAEHIASALGVYEQALASAAPRPVLLLPPRAPSPAPLLAVETKPASRWRDLWGWLGIAAGAAVFVAALAVPLDDTALVMALMLAVRGGRLMLDGAP